MPKAKLTKAKRKKKTPQPRAVHLTNGTKHIVGIGDIRVVIIQERDDLWFAQGLELDYAAQGVTLADVKKAFENGLAATVTANLERYETIEQLLKPAPPEVWKDLLYGTAKTGQQQQFRYSQVTLHEKMKKALPFAGIQFLLPQAA